MAIWNVQIIFIRVLAIVDISYFDFNLAIKVR